MSRKNETSGKKEVRIKNEKKRKEKEQKRFERKQQSRNGNNLDEMIAYVDEFGNISSTPPDLTQKKVINAQDIEIGIRRDSSTDNLGSMHSGVVAFFDEIKGYGFIKDSSTRQDIFVHSNALTEPIKENNHVTFEIIKGPRGLNAINVKIERD
jgi:cold shock CspA family protein